MPSPHVSGSSPSTERFGQKHTALSFWPPLRDSAFSEIRRMCLQLYCSAQSSRLIDPTHLASPLPPLRFLVACDQQHSHWTRPVSSSGNRRGLYAAGGVRGWGHAAWTRVAAASASDVGSENGAYPAQVSEGDLVVIVGASGQIGSLVARRYTTSQALAHDTARYERRSTLGARSSLGYVWEACEYGWVQELESYTSRRP